MLVCAYCGQTHAFVPPPLEPGPTGASSGSFTKLPLVIGLVAFAVALSAVVAFSALRSAQSPSTTTAATPGAASVTDPGDPNATYAVGDAVDIFWGSSWWPGSITMKDGKRYRITYEGWASTWDEWVTATRLRPRAKR